MKNKISFKDAYGKEIFTFMCILTLIVSYPLGSFINKFVYIKNMPDVMILNILFTCVIVVFELNGKEISKYALVDISWGDKQFVFETDFNKYGV